MGIYRRKQQSSLSLARALCGPPPPPAALAVLLLGVLSSAVVGILRFSIQSTCGAPGDLPADLHREEGIFPDVGDALSPPPSIPPTPRPLVVLSQPHVTPSSFPCSGFSAPKAGGPSSSLLQPLLGPRNTLQGRLLAKLSSLNPVTGA